MNVNTKKFCEAAMLGGALVLSLASMEASATAACANGAASSVAGSTSSFVRNTFPVKCSANVDVDYADGGTNFGVRGRSAKGKTLYGGSSDGGSVSACSTGATSAPAVGTATASLGC